MKRIFSLDALRAAMMLLGVVYHSFRFIYLDRADVSTDLSRTLIWFSHSFRMPVFMLIAGFFTHFLVVKKGYEYFWKTRLRRIVIPLLIGLVTVLPALYLTGYLAKFIGDGVIINLQALSDIAEISLKQFLKKPKPHVLWFLIFIVFYYVAYFLAMALVKKLALSDKIKDQFMKSIVWLTPFLTALLLLQMKSPLYINSSNKFIPPALPWLYYGVFFVNGCFIFEYYCKEKMDFFKIRPFILISTALLGAILIFLKYGNYKEALSIGPEKILLSCLFSFFVWGMSQSLTALFYRFLNFENRQLRYFADSSYWVYLVHIPLLNLGDGLALALGMGSHGRFLVGIIFALVVSFLSYNYIVFPSFLNQYFGNGKKS